MKDRGSLSSILNLRSSIARSRFLDIANKRFSLMHRNVWIGYEGRQLVDHVPRGYTFITPVPGHADLVNDFAVDSEGAHPARDESFGANLGAGAGDLAPVEILDALLLRQLRTDLD